MLACALELLNRNNSLMWGLSKLVFYFVSTALHGVPTMFLAELGHPDARCVPCGANCFGNVSCVIYAGDQDSD